MAPESQLPTLWHYLAFGLAGLFIILFPVFGRQRYRRIAAQFPMPPALPAGNPVDSFVGVQCYIQSPAGGADLGGSGHSVAVFADGFRLQGGWYLSGGQAIWVPWEKVESCEAVKGIDPGGEANPPGVYVALKGGAAAFRIADPAGDRVLGNWRLYQRRLRATAPRPAV